MGQKVVLVDSDILVASFYPDDANHQQAVEAMSGFNQGGVQLGIINLVLQESATVISYRMGMDEARKYFLTYGSVIGRIFSWSDRLEDLAWKLFLEQNKKGTSFVDCVNAVAVAELKLDGILSFDKFYRRIGVKTLIGH